MDLWLIRHTRPAIAEGVCYGSSDIALPHTFEEDARPLLAAVDIEPDTVVYSSPLARCAQLAQMLAQRASAPVFDARLQEMNFGDWELKPWAGLDRDELDRWARQPLDWRAPGGETARELSARACPFIEELQASGARTACVVSHGGVIRMLCARLWRQPMERALDLVIPFGSGLKVRWGRDAQLLATHGWNEAALPVWMNRSAGIESKTAVADVESAVGLRRST